MTAINLPDTWGLIEFSLKLALTLHTAQDFSSIQGFFPHIAVFIYWNLCDKWEELQAEQAYRSRDSREKLTMEMRWLQEVRQSESDTALGWEKKKMD